MKLQILIILWLTCGHPGCAPYKEAGYVWKGNSIDTSKIRFDGMYNTLDTSLMPNGTKVSDRNMTTAFVVFKKDQSIYRDDGDTIDSLPFTCGYFKQHYRKAQGHFEIRGDSVMAYLPAMYALRGVRFKTYNVWFRGFIKNKDTITDWKAVPPYPKKIGKWELKAEENKRKFTAQTLYFIKTDAVKCVETDTALLLRQ